MICHPDGIRRFILNWEEFAGPLVQMLHREAASGTNAGAARLRGTLLAYLGMPPRWKVPDPRAPVPPLLTMQLKRTISLSHSSRRSPCSRRRVTSCWNSCGSNASTPRMPRRKPQHRDLPVTGIHNPGSRRRQTFLPRPLAVMSRSEHRTQHMLPTAFPHLLDRCRQMSYPASN